MSFQPNTKNEIIIDGSYKYNKSEGKFLLSNQETDIKFPHINLVKVLNTSKFIDFNLDTMMRIDFNYAYYYQDKMHTGVTWYKKYKVQDFNIGPYFNSNIEISDLDSISVGFRYQWNWLRAGDMNNSLATSSAFSNGEQETIVKPRSSISISSGLRKINR